jgi:Spy/CpxP family protein refolding chaperone
MKRVASVLLSLLLAAIIAMPLLADDEPKKRPKRAPKKPDPAAMILKRLEKAELTEEQIAKVKELAAKIPPGQEGLNPEQKKALAEAMKKAKAEGKTREEIEKIRQSVVQLTEEQKAAMKKAQEARAAVMKEIMGLLTPEQKEKAGIKAQGKRDPAKKGVKKDRPKRKPKQEE